MSKDNPRGFVEHRNLGGRVAPITRTRKTKAGHLNHQLFAGDPVWLVSGNAVDRVPVATTTASAPILGVVRAVLNSNGRPFTHSLPANAAFIPASTAGFVQVNEDPQQTFLVSTDTTVTSSLIGQYVMATAAPANTAAGRSGMIIEVGTGTNTAAASVPFQVVELGANNLGGFDGLGGNQDVEVVIANHIWRNANRSV